MSEMEYCEDCKHIMLNTNCLERACISLAKCKKSPSTESIVFVMRTVDSLDQYKFCTTVRTGDTCPKFEAKDG